MITQLGYLGIGVKDIKEWEDFATNVLGLEVTEKLGDGTLYLRQDEYHHRFIVEPTGEDDIKYAGWMVPTLDALNEMQAQLQAAGVQLEEASPEECAHRKVAKMITFKDPDGTRLEVFYGLDVIVDRKFHSPRPISGFHASNLGLGHILLTVKDVEETLRFYRDILGFKVSNLGLSREATGQQISMAFMHVNPREHSLAFGAFPSPKRLNHWMMQVNDLDDVGFSYDLVQERGLPVRNHLGRHGNDKMVSFYVFTPSGFSVEMGAMGLEVDDNTWSVNLNNAGYMWGGKWGDQPDEAIQKWQKLIASKRAGA